MTTERCWFIQTQPDRQAKHDHGAVLFIQTQPDRQAKHDTGAVLVYTNTT